jgi:hypothetical protein
MLCKSLYALVVVGIGLGVASGETLKGKILKIDGKSVTFQAAKTKDAKTYDLAKTVKVFQMKKNDKEELSEGLKAEALRNIPDKGLSGMIVTGEDSKVTEIIVAKKKKKDNN